MSETLLSAVVQLALSATMTFNGTWKVDRNDNYDKFMEQMGEWFWEGCTGEGGAGGGDCISSRCHPGAVRI